MRTEKIKLSLNIKLLVKLAEKANMSRSEFVRGLISKELWELKGCLASSELSSKSKVRNSAIKKSLSS